jgi:hypothetical protein
MIEPTGLLASLGGSTVSVESEGGGVVRYRLTFDTPPVAGTVEIARLMGRIAAAAEYGSLAGALSVSVVALNGEVQAASDLALVVAAHKGDANADESVDFRDAALFLQAATMHMGGLDTWRTLDPRVLALTGHGIGRGSATADSRGHSTVESLRNRRQVAETGSPNDRGEQLRQFVAYGTERINFNEIFRASFEHETRVKGGGGRPVRACIADSNSQPISLADWWQAPTPFQKGRALVEAVDPDETKASPEMTGSITAPTSATPGDDTAACPADDDGKAPEAKAEGVESDNPDACIAEPVPQADSFKDNGFFWLRLLAIISAWHRKTLSARQGWLGDRRTPSGR